MAAVKERIFCLKNIFFQSAVGLTTIEKKFQNEETRILLTQRILSNRVEYLDII